MTRTALASGQRRHLTVEEFCRSLGLAGNATGSQIRAALAARRPRSQVQGAAAQPTRPRLTGVAVAAMSGEELQAVQGGALADDERRLVAAELEHRAFMGLTFGRAAGHQPLRRDMAARSGSVLKGLS